MDQLHLTANSSYFIIIMLIIYSLFNVIFGSHKPHLSLFMIHTFPLSCPLQDANLLRLSSSHQDTPQLLVVSVLQVSACGRHTLPPLPYPVWDKTSQILTPLALPIGKIWGSSFNFKKCLNIFLKLILSHFQEMDSAFYF